ncbi:hypothetical protein [Nostoc sp. 'Lobaria pulmonaria (5183) cyanobiont']|uniref:hypothetical protein n=1 Tax=Nostoc sp. 'Lobaria pulmonaria (5183) cyanobiont' TaxID=1618022 RepID=UPI001319E52A|nr:hypothetical protein [Nostoc sp. 'Lobaria pulmonaria (5183) cyanobiont']
MQKMCVKTARLRFFDENSRSQRRDRRQDERPIIVETAIHRVSYLNRTVLRPYKSPNNLG